MNEQQPELEVLPNESSIPEIPEKTVEDDLAEIYESLSDKDKARYSRVTQTLFSSGSGKVPRAALVGMHRPSRAEIGLTILRRILNKQKRERFRGAFGTQGCNRKAAIRERVNRAKIQQADAKFEQEHAEAAAKYRKEVATRVVDKIMEAVE